MKASELIKRLQELIEEHGDNDIYYVDENDLHYSPNWLYTDQEGDIIIDEK